MSQKARRILIAAVALTGIGAVALVLSRAGAAPPHSGSLIEQARPETIANLVDSSDLIIDGVVTVVYSSQTTVLVTPHPTPADNHRKVMPEPLDFISTTRVQLDIETTYLDDQGTRPVVYGRWGDTSAGTPSDWPFPEVGDTYMYFLAAEPSSTDYHVLFGACGRILLLQSGPACSDEDEYVPEFLEDMTSEEFIDLVEDSIG